MKGSDKAIVLGVVMAVALAAFYFMIVSPKREKAAELGQDVSKLKSQVSQQQQIAEFGEQARNEFPTYYGRLVVMGKAVPAGADTASLMVQLSAIAGHTNVVFRGITLAASDTSSASPTSTSASTASAPTTSTAPTSTSATSTTSTTPSPSASGGSSTSSSTATPAANTTTPTTVAAPATETAAANLPIGAIVGPGDLATMPYSLNFTGSYFQVAQFIQGVDDLIHTHGTTQVGADGRLLTIDGFSFSEPQGTGPNPNLNVAISVTSFVAPASQGLTAGATPSGPAPSLSQPQTQPTSATVTP